MTLYPWHKCDARCLWWGAGNGLDLCNFDNIAMEADTGRPGCHHWICSSCGYAWDEFLEHDSCNIIEVELET